MIETEEQWAARRLSQLPKWARERIAILEQVKDDQARRIAALSEGPADSDTYVNGLGIYPDRELGTGVEVTFRLPDGSQVRARVRDGYVELNTLGAGGRSVSVSAQPSSGNVLRVRPELWW